MSKERKSSTSMILEAVRPVDPHAKKPENKAGTDYSMADSVRLKVVPDNNSAQVLVGKHARTQNNAIYSTNFGPCVAVVAKLKEGGFILYHARDGEGFSAFVNEAKGKVSEVHVFRKSGKSNEQNRKKAPILAANLTTELGMEVLCVEVEAYTTVICDATSGRNHVILAKNLQEVGEADVVEVLESENLQSLDEEIKSAGKDVQNMAYTAEVSPDMHKLLVQKRTMHQLREMCVAAKTADTISDFIKPDTKNNISQKDLLETFAYLAAQPVRNTIAIKAILSSDGLKKTKKTNEISNFIHNEFYDALKERDVEKLKSVENKVLAIIEADENKFLTVFSHIEKIGMCEKMPRVKEAFLQTDASQRWVEKMSVDRLLRTTRELGEPFAKVLIKTERLKELSQDQRRTLMDRYESVALAIAKDPIARDHIAWSKKAEIIGKQSWKTLMAKYPTVAQEALSNPSWKNNVEKLTSARLLYISSKDAKSANAVFQHFKESGIKESKSNTFSRHASFLHSSTNKPKLTKDEWLKVFVDAGPEVVSMIPSKIFDQFDVAQCELLKVKNPNVADHMSKTFSKTDHVLPSKATESSVLSSLKSEEKVFNQEVCQDRIHTKVVPQQIDSTVSGTIQKMPSFVQGAQESTQVLTESVSQKM